MSQSTQRPSDPATQRPSDPAYYIEDCRIYSLSVWAVPLPLSFYTCFYYSSDRTGGNDDTYIQTCDPLHLRHSKVCVLRGRVTFKGRGLVGVRVSHEKHLEEGFTLTRHSI